MKAVVIVFGLALLGALAWFLFVRPAVGGCGCGRMKGLPSAGIGQLLDRPSEYLAKDVRIQGTVGRQCPRCGCWFTLREPGGRELKVEAGDLGESLPYRPGRKATVEGRLIRFGDGVEFVAAAVEID